MCVCARAICVCVYTNVYHSSIVFFIYDTWRRNSGYFHLTQNPHADIQECHTSKISKFVNHYPQLQVKTLFSYIKDTSDCINKISETENMTIDKFLVALDVKSLLMLS